HIKLRLPGKPLNYLLIWVKPFTLAHTDKTVFGSRPPALICCLAEACPCIQHKDVGGASHVCGCVCVVLCLCVCVVCVGVGVCGREERGGGEGGGWVCVGGWGGGGGGWV